MNENMQQKKIVHFQLPEDEKQEKQSSDAAALPRNILLTNDDGPPNSRDSLMVEPFLNALSQYGSDTQQQHILVCLPSAQQSSTSMSFSRGCIKAEFKKRQEKGKRKLSYVYVDGSPATSVNIGIANIAPLFELDIELTISGPNTGHNAGRASVLSSGTVGAANQAAILGKKAIALSFHTTKHTCTQENIENASLFSVELIYHIYRHWPKEVDIFNINVPLGSGRHPQVYDTFINMDSYGQMYTLDASKSSDSIIYLNFGITGVGASQTLVPGSDEWVLFRKNAVSVTALTTNFAQPKKYKRLFRVVDEITH